MQGNEPNNNQRTAVRGAPQDTTNTESAHFSSLSLPTTEEDGHLAASERPSQSAQEFDQKVTEYGEALKAELVKNTPRDVWGRPTWEPYRLNIDHIPATYHQRITHYLLEAYQLPEAERHVAYNAPVFKETNLTSLAGALAARGSLGLIALGEHLHNFRGGDEHQLLKLLLRSPSPWNWLRNADFFPPASHATILKRALHSLETKCLFDNFSKLNLSNAEQENVVNRILKSARRHKWYAKLGSSWAGKGLAPIEKLPIILHKMAVANHTEALQKAVAFSPSGAFNVAANLHRYSRIDYQALAKTFQSAHDSRPWKILPHRGLRLRQVAKYFADFPSLNREQQSARLFEIAPSAVLADMHAHPSIDPLHVARANLYTVGRHVDTLKQLSPSDLTSLALEIVNKDPGWSAWQLFRNFRQLVGLNLEELANETLAKRPDLFLDAGSFLGFRPSELLHRLLQMGAAQDPQFFAPDRGPQSQAEKWIRCGGHDQQIAASFIAVGKGHLVIENISCFSDIAANLLYRAALQCTLWHIVHGRVDSAKACLSSYKVSADELNIALETDSRHFFEAPQLYSESTFRRATIAAWSLYHPEIRQLGIFRDDPSILEPYRTLLGSDKPEQLERNANQKLLENLVSVGIPLLIRLRWLRDDTIAQLSEILPKFLESTTGSARAWKAHQVNLHDNKEEPYRPGPFCRDDVNPVAELSLLRLFYEEFGVIQAPTLYLQGVRGCTAVAATEGETVLNQAMPSDAELRSLHTRLKQQKNMVARDLLPSSSDLSSEGLEYLAGWTGTKDEQKDDKRSSLSLSANARSFSKKLWRHQELLRNGIISPKAKYLRPQSIHVRYALKPAALEGKVAVEIGQQYKWFRSKLADLLGASSTDVFLKEKTRVITNLEKRLRSTEQWLERTLASTSESPETSKARKIRDTLFNDLSELDMMTSPQELISFICVRSAVDFRNVVVNLAISLGLEATSVDDREDLQALSSLVTRDSIRIVYSFLTNALLQVSLRTVEEKFDEYPDTGEPPSSALPSPSSSGAAPLAVAGEYLNHKAFEDAYRRMFEVSPVLEDSISVGVDPEREEIIVLPTRGILAEVAGYFSDACWTDHNDLMLKHPNATALIFAKRRAPVSEEELLSESVDLSEAELIGACYILKVRDLDGNDVIALRGLNPRIRKIKNLDIGSFVTSLIEEALVPYAKALGARKIVVPFDYLGHAQTNVLEIRDFLNQRYGGSPYVPLDPAGPSTLFNERLIFDKCRLLREI